MNTKRISFVNVTILLSILLAVALVWAVARNTVLDRTREEAPQFVYTLDLTVSPANEISQTKPISEPVIKAIEKPISKVETITAPKPVVQPLPLVPPKIMFQVLPTYPESALSEGVEGRVLLSLFVRSDGKVEKAKIVETSGHSELDNAALQAGKGWIFEPARRGAQPIESWFKIPVKFVLE